MSTELVVLEDINVIDIFKGESKNAEELLEKIRTVALSEVPDLKTAKGRKAIASNAAKVAKCKTYLEDQGKNLVADEKKKLKLVDDVRKKVRDQLDELKAEVRKPLTDWENKEKERVAKYEDIIASFVVAANDADNWMAKTVIELKELLNAVEETKVTKRFQEFEDEAINLQKMAIKKISESIESRTQYETDQADLEQLRAQREEDDRKRFEANERAEADRAAQQKIIDANNETKAAEQRAAEAEKQRVIEAEAAEEKRIKDVEAAAQAEIDRLAAEQKAEEQATAAREADTKHRGKINRAIVKELLNCGADETQAKAIVTAIAQNKVPNVKINY